MVPISDAPLKRLETPVSSSPALVREPWTWLAAAPSPTRGTQLACKP